MPGLLREVAMTQPSETSPPPPAQPAEPTEPTPTKPTGDPPAASEELGEAGKKALAAEREARKAAERELTKYKTAATDAQKDVLKKITEALGMAGEKVDPDELARQLTNQQSAAASAQLELQVWQAADKLGALPHRLLDSRRFTDEVNGLPDDDFDTGLEALITKWLTDDPSLRRDATRQPANPKPDPSQGPRGGNPTGRPTSLGQAVTKALSKS
jgi:hypothetical protein